MGDELVDSLDSSTAAGRAFREEPGLEVGIIPRFPKVALISTGNTLRPLLANRVAPCSKKQSTGGPCTVLVDLHLESLWSRERVVLATFHTPLNPIDMFK